MKIKKNGIQMLLVDGVPLQYVPPDLDGDGVVGGVEKIQAAGVQSMVQPSELGDSLKELNKDIIETNTNQSGIDMRSRLHPIEVSSLLAIDGLVAMKFLPQEVLLISRQKKRLAVSIDGLGRKEIVEIVRSKRDHDSKMSGVKDRLKNFMGMKDKVEQNDG